MGETGDILESGDEREIVLETGNEGDVRDWR